jgi:hypothetical protein
MSSVQYNRKAGTVTVTADDGTERIWPLATFEADPAACVAQTGNGINAPVPATIKASQARVALHRAGLLASVTALVDNPATDAEIKIFWEYEVDLDRDSPALNAMAGALGLTQEQLDDLFRTASLVAI